MIIDHLLREGLHLAAARLFQGQLAALDFQVAGLGGVFHKVAIAAVQLGRGRRGWDRLLRHAGLRAAESEQREQRNRGQGAEGHGILLELERAS